jgi:hypothetical protein
MSGVFASRTLRCTALAFGLCILAFVFAMEAKLAWYGPASGPGCDIRAAKACPADTATVVSHGSSAPIPVHPLIPFVVLAAFTAACLLKTDVLLKRNIEHNRLPVASTFCFSSNLFFRPPPVR